jgi:hypothetical protein
MEVQGQMRLIAIDGCCKVNSGEAEPDDVEPV